MRQRHGDETTRLSTVVLLFGLRKGIFDVKDKEVFKDVTMVAPPEIKARKAQECHLSGQHYIWQLVPQSLNPKAGLTLIIGNSGSGKTFWHQRLQQSLAHCESISCQRNVNLMNLIKQFSYLYGTQPPLGPQSIEEQAQAILAHLPAAPQRYLLIDDANWLTRESLTWLLHLAKHYEEHHLSIILFGPKLLLQRVNSLNAAHTQIHTHEVHLRPLNAEEIEAFVKQTYVIHQPIAASVLRRIQHASGGSPREVMKLVQDNWSSIFCEDPPTDTTQQPPEPTSVGSEEATISSTPRVLPFRLLLSLLLLGVILLLMLLRHPSASAKTISTKTPGSVTAEKIQDVPPTQDTTSEDPLDESPFNLEILTVSLEDDPTDEAEEHEPLAPNAQDSSHVSDSPESLPHDVAAPTTTAWYQQPGYLIQVALKPKKQKMQLEALAEHYASIATPHILCVMRKEQSQCLLLLGPFAEPLDARAALKKLPPDLVKAQHCWIRTTQSLTHETLDAT